MAYSYRFGGFWLDPDQRLLTSRSGPVDLNTRYFDALALLVRERGKLVTKDRFLEEVWAGVPVTDEALTQCIRVLRRQLGDSAASPRFIETVPKHGYRFIAPVDNGDAPPPDAPVDARLPDERWRRGSWAGAAWLGAAGTAGGGVAGLVGGLFYGLAGASQPLQPGPGAASVLLVVMIVTVLVALLGSAGVAFGIAATRLVPARRWYWPVVGGAAGGMLVGAFGKLLGMDAFALLLGHAPRDMTGAAEGLVLGAGVGLGAWLAVVRLSIRRAIVAAAACGCGAGLLVTLAGGRLMGGSLDLLARQIPGSRLRLDQIGALVGEAGFGPTTRLVTSALEGLLFSACVVGAMIFAQRRQRG